MGTVDLHTHSTFSDGTCSPSELVNKAVSCGLQAIALTDHDTVEGIPDFLKAAKDMAIEAIPGTELSVGFRDRDIHIVGLFIDHTHEGFQKMSQIMIKRRDARNEEMAARFRRDNIPITMEELTNGNPDAVVTRAHFARLLIKYGVVKNTAEAFDGYLDPSAPYYVPREYISREEGIKTILAAGGVPLHLTPLQSFREILIGGPSFSALSEKELCSLLTELKEYGLLGIEVKYSTYSKQDEYFIRNIAKKFDLLPSGGSDFHGTNKPHISLGSGMGHLAVPYEYLQQMKEYAARS